METLAPQSGSEQGLNRLCQERFMLPGHGGILSRERGT